MTVVGGSKRQVNVWIDPGKLRAYDLTAADVERARRALADVGIEDLADRSMLELSGGERQLVLVARALAQEPRVVVFDEPTASLDFGNQVLVLGEVKKLAASGLGIVLSTHNPDHAFACASRVQAAGWAGAS